MAKGGLNTGPVNPGDFKYVNSNPDKNIGPWAANSTPTDQKDPRWADYQAQQNAWKQQTSEFNDWQSHNVGGFLNPNEGGVRLGYQVQGKATPGPQAPTPSPFDSSGYLSQLQQPNVGANPYANQGTADNQNIYQSTQSAQKNINTYQAKADNGAGYPSMPNAYGLGDSSAFGGQQAAASKPQGSVTQSAPDTSSRGFNPWSLQGESNARGN